MVACVRGSLFLILLSVSALACASSAPCGDSSYQAFPTTGSDEHVTLQPVYVEGGQGRVLLMLPLPLQASACRLLGCVGGPEQCVLRESLPPVATCRP